MCYWSVFPRYKLKKVVMPLPRDVSRFKKPARRLISSGVRSTRRLRFEQTFNSTMNWIYFR